MKLAELKTKLAQTRPGSPVHRALKTAIAQAEAKLAADEAARLEAEAKARAEAEALAEAEEKARLEVEAAERARLEAEVAEKARLGTAEEQQLEEEAAEKPQLEAEASENTRRKTEVRTRTGAEPFYQAVGTIRGRLSRDDNGKIHLSAYGADWVVEFLNRSYKAVVAAFKANDPRLHGELDLLCYPIIYREPGGNYYIAGFQVVGFSPAADEEADAEPKAEAGEAGAEPKAEEAGAKPKTEEMGAEFMLAGVWQWLPTMRKQGVSYPVLSVYRNQQPVEGQSRPPYLTTHCPVIWSKRKPWARSHQCPPPWVRIRARLLPAKKVFKFVEVLDECEFAPQRIRDKTPKQQKQRQKQKKQKKPNPDPHVQRQQDMDTEPSNQGATVEPEAVMAEQSRD